MKFYFSVSNGEIITSYHFPEYEFIIIDDEIIEMKTLFSDFNIKVRGDYWVEEQLKEEREIWNDFKLLKVKLFTYLKKNRLEILFQKEPLIESYLDYRYVTFYKKGE